MVLNIPKRLGKLRKISFSLQSKMMVYFGILFAIVLILAGAIRLYGLPWSAFKGEYAQRRVEVFEQLSEIADTKQANLRTWLQQRLYDAQVLSDSLLFQQNVYILFQQLPEIRTHNNKLVPALNHIAIHEAITQHLQLIKNTYQAYTSLQLIDPNTGDIIVSSDVTDVGQNIADQPFFRSIVLPSNNGLIDTKLQHEHLGLFIARHIPAPQGELSKVAVLILNISDPELDHLLSIQNTTGKSSEAVLMTRSMQLLSSLKYSPAEGKTSGSLSDDLNQALHPLVSVAQAGTVTAKDYRDKDVLAIYRPLPITAAIDWGLVVKVDQVEVFARIQQNIQYSLIVGGIFSILLGLGGTFLLARRLSYPIEMLSNTIQRIEDGDIYARAEVTSFDEVGKLARLFNGMIERVHRAQSELEELIDSRTAELYKTNVNLAITLDEMKNLNTHLSQEIAVRREIEIQIRKKQVIQQTIFDSVPAFIWRKDTENRILWMNKAASELSGVHPESPQGYHLSELFPQHTETWFKDDLEVVRSKQPKLGVLAEVCNTRGECLTIQLDKVPYIDEEGNVIGVIVLATDITARLQAEQAMYESEQRFRAIVNTAVDGIVMINECGIIQLLNPALAKMFGYELEELLGTNLGVLMPSPHHRKHDEYLRHYLKTGEQHIIGSGREIVAQHKDGSIFPIYLAVSELRLKDQRMFTGIISDITELKQAQLALEESKQELEIQNKAYSRFVPREFLSFLEKRSIVDVQLGDHVQKEMTIMFSDIRAFTALSEKMTPTENFRFINSYLSKMEPVVLSHHGFIDKYIGDAIMALFPHGADDAVRGAIDMLRTLSEFNQARQHANTELIDIGIGLHTGTLMLGTIGGENRMDGTVISDAVNLASRVEGMTKMYGATLLITEHTYNRLVDVSEYAIRIVDKVKVKGKSQPVIVFEVLDGNLPEIRDAKLATLEMFTDAFVSYQRRNFDYAESLFQRCVDRNPNDKAAKIYLKRSQYWQRFGDDQTWNGVTELESKDGA
jgi:PAS domain S-box-containing protein